MLTGGRFQMSHCTRSIIPWLTVVGTTILIVQTAHAQSFATTSGPIRGSIEGEVKVTDADPSHEGSPAFSGSTYQYSWALTCDPDHYRTVSGGTPASWPFTTAELDHYYQTTTPTSGGIPSSEPSYDAGVWALNDANSTISVLWSTGQNLYIADVNNAHSYVTTWGEEAARNHCNWMSWAALNDVLQFRLDSATPNYLPTYTGAALGAGGGDLVNRWACTYRDFIGRARQEGAEHPDIVKVIYFDELWRFMVGPENAIWHGGAHWTVDNVNALADMVQSGTYGGQDTDYTGATDSSCPTSHTIAGTQALELWSRMFSPGIPRYIVPSAMLGVAADPVAVSGGTGDSSVYGFEGGDELTVTWTGITDGGTPTWPATWRVNLEFLYADGDHSAAAGQGLLLTARVNGTATNSIPLFGKETVEIHRGTACLDSSFACAHNVWKRGAARSNTISFTLSTTNTNTDLDVDRTAYVWAVRVNYVDTSTGNVFWTSDFLNPDSASYSQVDGGTANTLGSDALAQSNGDAHPTDPNLADGWRVTDHLDGVAVTQHHGSTQFDSTAFDHLMEHTCDHLQNAFPTAKGCLVDETGSARGNGTTNYGTIYASYPTDEAWYRMDSADTWGDGVVSYYLPLSLENVGTNGGRYAERDTLSSGYSTVTYEPRLTRSYIGEVQEWEWTVPSGCAGTYKLDWEVAAETDAPVFEWFVDHNGSGTRSRFDFGDVDTSPANTSGNSTPILSVGDTLWVGWESYGGGATLKNTNNVHFVIDSAASPCTPGSTGTAWTHSTRFSDLSGPSVWSGSTLSAAEGLYECIIRYYQSSSNAGDGDMDDCK